MAEAAYAPDLDLRAHLTTLLQRKKLILAVTGALVALTLLLSLLQKPLYQAKVKVLLRLKPTEQLFNTDVNAGQQTDAARTVETEQEVVKSEPVRAAVRNRIGPVAKAGVEEVGHSDLIAIIGSGGTAARAAVVARAYADAYLEYRRTQDVSDLQDAGRRIQAKVDDLQAQIEALNTQIAGEANQTTKGSISSTRDHLVTQQALFRQRLDELQVESEVNTGGARLVTRTRPAVEKVKPAPLRNALVALPLGLLLGTGLAFLLEYLDDSIKTKDELDRAAPDLRVLAMVPAVDEWTDADQAFLVSLREPDSPASEAYRSLRTSLQFLGVERAPRILQVTSGNLGEGKTSTVSNLAVSLARAGHRVVMFDADLRRAHLHDFFRLPNTVGFTSVFIGETDTASAVQPVPAVDGLFLLASGPLPPNPSELLLARRTAEIISELRDAYDYVLIDTPPVLPVTDATALSAWSDATLIVASSGITSRKDLKRTLELLRQVQAPLAGIVFNRVPAGVGYGYPYRYERRADTGVAARPAPAPPVPTPSPSAAPDNGDRPIGSDAPPVRAESRTAPDRPGDTGA